MPQQNPQSPRASRTPRTARNPTPSTGRGLIIGGVVVAVVGTIGLIIVSCGGTRQHEAVMAKPAVPVSDTV